MRKFVIAGVLLVALMVAAAWALEFRPIPLKVTEKPELTSDGRIIYEFQRPLELKKNRAYMLKFTSPCGVTAYIPRNHDIRTVREAEGHFEERFGGGIVCTDPPRLFGTTWRFKHQRSSG